MFLPFLFTSEAFIEIILRGLSGENRVSPSIKYGIDPIHSRIIYDRLKFVSAGKSWSCSGDVLPRY